MTRPDEAWPAAGAEVMIEHDDAPAPSGTPERFPFDAVGGASLSIEDDDDFYLDDDDDVDDYDDGFFDDDDDVDDLEGLDEEE
jgi:hypothetical protein